jgi:hypothetical protein
MKPVRTSLAILAMAVLFIIIEQCHFGWSWHWMPKSDAELLGNGIAAILCSLALIAQSLEKLLEKKP